MSEMIPKAAVEKLIADWRALADGATDDIVPGDDCAVARWTMAEMLADELQALIASASVSPPAPTWRPIESAPKDGHWLMLYVRWQDKRDIIGCGQWTKDGGGDYCWFWPWSNAPTHWMPLPDPPPSSPSPAETGEQ